MDKQKQIEEMEQFLVREIVCSKSWKPRDIIERLSKMIIPEGAVVLTRDELDEVLDTCKCAMIVTDDDGEQYVSLDDYDEYTDRLGKIARQRKVRIEYLEKLLDDRCDRCIERIRKETTEKYHTKVNEAIDSVPNATKEFVEAWKAKNDKIAKEITEGENG